MGGKVDKCEGNFDEYRLIIYMVGYGKMLKCTNCGKF